MATKEYKEKLFQDFYTAAKETFLALEDLYAIQGVVDQIFGDSNIGDQEREKLRGSCAWETLSALYEYAINGISSADPTDLVIGGSEIIKLASCENAKPCDNWDDIIAMGDGRFALDEGQSISFRKLALLANVDIRTVRNAASSGELITHKFTAIEAEESGELPLNKDDDGLRVDNASARKWLLSRRGFKSTILSDSMNQHSLENVSTPGMFSEYLTSQRQRINLSPESKLGKLMPLHPDVTAKSLTELEAGVFSLPLSAVFPLADFYQIDRKQFLACVMRVFFPEEMAMLDSASTMQNAG